VTVQEEFQHHRDFDRIQKEKMMRRDVKALNMKELKEWTSRYANEASASKFINETIGNITGTNFDKKQLKYTPVLAKLLIDKDYPDRINEHYGTLYRWFLSYELQYEKPSDVVNVKKHVKNDMYVSISREMATTQLPVTEGFCLTLQVSMGR
jgi:hypothetical protein